MTTRFFIDSHCHFFNLDDVPLLSTLKAQIPVSSILALGLSLRPLAISAIDKYKDFIQFFERPREANLKLYSDQIWQAIGRDQFDKLLLTPLIMDFSKIQETCEETQDQTTKLLNAIETTADQLKNTVICPLWGFDLRHIYACQDQDSVRAKIYQLSSEAFDIGAFTPPKTLDDLTTGTLAGIKLYPSIGFSPFPANTEKRQASLVFFTICEANEIPITVHCQPVVSGSYRPDEIGKEAADDFTHPEHWKHVLAACPDLKINFAHFGGETMVREAFFKASQPYARKPPKKGWCWDIVEMLKCYPNTYADLSAFNFSNPTWATALGVMLVLDDLGKLDEFLSLYPHGSTTPYRLSDKLLWGSDFPMVIKMWDNNYANMLNAFKQTLDLTDACQNLKDASQWPEFDAELPFPGLEAAVLENFVSINPGRFMLTKRQEEG